MLNDYSLQQKGGVREGGKNKANTASTMSKGKGCSITTTNQKENVKGGEGTNKATLQIKLLDQQVTASSRSEGEGVPRSMPCRGRETAGEKVSNGTLKALQPF